MISQDSTNLISNSVKISLEVHFKKELRSPISTNYLEHLYQSLQEKFGKKTDYLFQKFLNLSLNNQKKHKSLIKINGSQVEVVSSMIGLYTKKKKL